MASAIDPMGAANGVLFGERWLRTPPPHLHAFIALGPNLGIGAANASSFHSELSVTDLGPRTFLEASAVIAIVPWGAAGGSGDIEGVRDYAHAPGASEVFEVKLGMRGLGVARVSARAIQIAGKLVDEGNEAVVLSSAGAMFAIAEHHALGFELAYSARYASLSDAPDPFDQSAQLRLVYALTSDSMFGGGEN